MSFKREGDDRNQISVLRKRRISDLLAIKIPEDEAKLLSNGRFACTVCTHKPVFDTVNMLAVHRKGKKHQIHAEYQTQQKEELQDLIQKRKQEQFLQNRTTDIHQPVIHHRGICSAVAYDSRVKKHKLKPYERKPRLDLEAQSSGNAGSETDLQRNRMSEMVAMQMDGPFKHSHQLKNIFEPKNSTVPITRPYVSKRMPKRNASVTCAQGHGRQNHVTVGNTEERHVSKVQLGKHCLSTSSNYEKNQTSTSSCSSSQSLPEYSSECFPAKQNICLPSHVNIQNLAQAPPPAPPEQVSLKDIKVSTSSERKSISEKEKNQAKKYWELRGSGWKKDWDGKWIRDEDAEFDSDEEAPDLP